VGIFELFQGQRGPIGKLTNRLLGLDRASAALVKKDTLSFIREPAQWGQSALIFGLLFFYTSNLRRLGYDLDDPVWSVVISHLNVLVCSLSVSTLTTRFIFPQFSMEGQRLWILGISPVPLRRLLTLKLRLNGSVMALMTTGLILISSVTISLPGSRVLYFFCAMILLSYGLTALALALGTLLPNFREPNPAKIVSGFGGTLCLITSFLYIMVSMVVLLIPALVSLKPQFFGFAEAPKSLAALECLGISGIAVATLLFGAVPYIIAKKSTKDLDYLRYV
jgi:ABC-2 type transport system permease protein